MIETVPLTAQQLQQARKLQVSLLSFDIANARDVIKRNSVGITPQQESVIFSRFSTSLTYFTACLASNLTDDPHKLTSDLSWLCQFVYFIRSRDFPIT